MTDIELGSERSRVALQSLDYAQLEAVLGVTRRYGHIGLMVKLGERVSARMAVLRNSVSVSGVEVSL